MLPPNSSEIQAQNKHRLLSYGTVHVSTSPSHILGALADAF